jgi:multiple sugar transport system permease protein
VIYLAAFYAWPLYRNLDLSLRHYTVRSFVQGNAPFSGLDNYTKVLSDPTFGPALLHTIVFTAVSLLFQFSIGMALAVFFTHHFRLSATLRALFLVPWLLPLIVSASTWSWMLNSDSGIINAALGAVGVDPVNWLTSPRWALTSVIIANIWIGIPFNLVVLYSGLQAIPTDIHEAAAIDGATGFTRFWYITLPLLSPMTFFVLIISIIGSFQVFELVYVMTKAGPANATNTLVYYIYQNGFSFYQMGYGSAAAMVLFVIVLVATLVQYRLQDRWVHYD